MTERVENTLITDQWAVNKADLPRFLDLATSEKYGFEVGQVIETEGEDVAAGSAEFEVGDGLVAVAVSYEPTQLDKYYAFAHEYFKGQEDES